MNCKAELDLAIEAARGAGARLRALMDRRKAVLSNEGRDIKLQADRDSEATIMGILSKSEYAVLAEESGEHGVIDANNPFWIVDPLDGTLNFSRGLPMCCVSIALSRGTEPILGVVYDFNHDAWFSGIVGEGAWLDGEPMSVSKIAKPADAILATGFPVNRDFGDDSLAAFLDKVKRFKKVRLLGSAALSLAYVACGRVDAYSEEDIMFWDVAAGIALVKAAGGYTSVLDSDRIKWGKRVYCASNQGIWNS